MSLEVVNLCSILLKQQFGEVVEEVGKYLAEHGARSLQFISRDVKKCSIQEIKKALLVLLHHNLAMFIKRINGTIQYQLHVENVLLIVRYPRYIYAAKVLYGNVAEIVVEEILSSGRLQMSSTVQMVVQRLIDVPPKEAGDIFKTLVEAHFLRRVPAPVKAWKEDEGTSKSQCPNIEVSEDKAHTLVEINLNLIQINGKNEEENDQPPSDKKIKLDYTQPDVDTYWMIDFERFHQFFRDQEIIKLATKRVDVTAGEIVRALLRCSEVNTPSKSLQTNPITRHEIMDRMRKDNNLREVDKNMDSYLTLLAGDAPGFFKKFDERSGGMYVIDLAQAFAVLAEANIIAAVQDRFGSKCARIFRMLLISQYLDQKQIEEKSLIPPKDAKEYVYKMINENFISLKEIPQTPDFAPSRTFFLFHVDIDRVCKNLIYMIHQAMYNAISRSIHEKKTNKRLLEKEKTIKLIVAKLQSENALDEHIQEVQDSITPPEKEQLEKLKGINHKLTASQIQMDETLFVLKSYLESKNCK